MGVTMIMKAVVALALLATAYAYCRIGYSPGGNTWNACYSIPRTTATWSDAQTMCMMQNAYLADIQSGAERQVVINLAKYVPGLHRIWLGSRKHVPVSNQWRWGRNAMWMLYSPWGPREPSGDGLCLDMLKVWAYKFNDERCHRADVHFVCKYYNN